MLNKKLVVLGAAAVLAVSLIGGLTYAWFTGQASVSVGGSADENGIKGGLVAGHVDLKVDVKSYTVDANGTPLTNVDTDKPYIIYPGDIVTQDGASVPGAKSVIQYTIANTSGTEVIARLDQPGLTIGKATPAGPDTVTNAYANIRQLLGYDNNESKTANTWFYFAKKPVDNSNWRYVDIEKLKAYSFQPYKVNEVAAGSDMNGKAFYAPGRDISLAGTDIGVKMTSTVTKSDPSILLYTDGTGADALTYLRMPKDSNVKIELQLALDGAGGSNDNAFLGDNRYQFAVYTLTVLAGDQTDPLDPRLYAYATQVKTEAVNDFYGSTVAGRISGTGKLGTFN